MFLRSNIDDYAFSIPPMQRFFRSLIIIGMPALRYVHQCYMQYFSRPEFSPKQLPYQLRQLVGLWESNRGEQSKRACAIPLQRRTRARNQYERTGESLDCLFFEDSRSTSEVSVDLISESSRTAMTSKTYTMAIDPWTMKLGYRFLIR